MVIILYKEKYLLHSCIYLFDIGFFMKLVRCATISLVNLGRAALCFVYPALLPFHVVAANLFLVTSQ